MIRLLLACAAALLLSSCGGSSASTPSQPPPPPPAIDVPLGPARKGYWLGYYYSDDQQVAETADHVNLIHVPSAGSEWWFQPQGIIDTAISRLKLARDAGIGKAILTMDFCGFERQGKVLVYHGGPVVRDFVTDYLTQVRAAGLLDMIVGLYTVDEPERDGVTAFYLQSFCTELRAVCGIFQIAPALCVIYTDDKVYPAIEAHDWVGIDPYDHGTAAMGPEYLGDMLTHMRDDQRVILVPPCAAPWRADPRPYYDFANSNVRVAWIAPFAWCTPGGLRSNPVLQPAYRAIGQAIKGANAL